MKKIFLLLLLLPLLLTAQRNRQCKKCQDPCTGCAAPAKDSTRPMNITINCQHQGSRDTVILKQDIVTGESKGKNWLLDLIAPFMVFAATALGFWYAQRRILSENRLKATLEWIKDFRLSAGGLMNGIASTEAAISRYQSETEKQEEKEKAEKAEKIKKDRLEKRRDKISRIYHSSLNKQFKKLKPHHVNEANKDIAKQEGVVAKAAEETAKAIDKANEANYIAEKEMAGIESLCNQVTLFLDSNATKQQMALKYAVEDLQHYNYDRTDTEEGLKIVQNVKAAVLNVIAEKWSIAEKQFEFKWPKFGKKGKNTK